VGGRGTCRKFNRVTRPTGRPFVLVAKPKPNRKKKSSGADEKLQGFKTGEKEKWWCRRDGGDKGQRGQVTKGERQGGQCLFLPMSQTGEKNVRIESCVMSECNSWKEILHVFVLRVVTFGEASVKMLHESFHHCVGSWIVRSSKSPLFR
jgi:hypothetical protein